VKPTDDDLDDLYALGPCCICETDQDVRNIAMLDQRAPIAGHGWGCVVCDLPPDGALAVLCDRCAGGFESKILKLQFACRGYPASEGRVPFEDLDPAPFEHDRRKHPEASRRPGFG
jgi:hypothetical protein